MRRRDPSAPIRTIRWPSNRRQRRCPTALPSAARCSPSTTRPASSISPGRSPRRGVELVSTGGTRAGARPRPASPSRDVSELTGFPEIMDGRVKTLHPTIHGGLLGVRDDARARRRDGRRTASRGIDLLVVNLYPFEETVAAGADERTMRREHRHRRPGHDPRRRQEPRLRRRRRRPGRLRRVARGARRERRRARRWRSASALAAKAFARTAAYDAAISGWFADAARRDVPDLAQPSPARLAQTLRYGENPHQTRRASTVTGEQRARASPPRASSRARSSPTTTSTTPTPPSSWSPSSIPSDAPPSPSSSTPTPAASRSAPTLAEAYRKALALRSGLAPSAASSR